MFPLSAQKVAATAPWEVGKKRYDNIDYRRGLAAVAFCILSGNCLTFEFIVRVMR